MAGKAVVVISRDAAAWSSLKARLAREGYQVHSFQAIRDACHWIHLGGRVPSATIIDISRDTTNPENLGWIKDLSDRCPLFFIAGARGQIPSELESFGEVLRRPIPLGEILSKIRPRI